MSPQRLLLLILLTTSLLACQSGQTAVWEIPGDRVFPEGIAIDPGSSSFYVGSTEDGTVYRGDVEDPGGGMTQFLLGGQDGRTTVTGLAVDEAGRLFVAGRDSNRFFVYDTEDGGLLADLTPPEAERTLLNDIAVTPEAAYVTDSFRDTLFRILLDGEEIGDIEPWLDLSETPIEYESGFNLNGVEVTTDGQTLLTVQYNTGQLYRIETSTGAIEEVDLGGEALRTGDGMVLDGRTLHVVLGGPGEIVTVALSEDLRRGEIVDRTTSEEWRAPTTIAATGEDLLVVNSQLNMTGADEQPTLPFSITSVAPSTGGG
ncbi:SMP-30/gluconolactonase/LRE family protein [Euzebya tangerina]|uniref:SMP-30/gluconolactonase/LRE family protein n=1 Tax=Euzebya tangerina TaxID=591198 RepID=UPI000E31F3C7|nr:SMP-30/gluconolactonase/LRE family protein [Euzebya tangerina]